MSNSKRSKGPPTLTEAEGLRVKVNDTLWYQKCKARITEVLGLGTYGPFFTFECLAPEHLHIPDWGTAPRLYSAFAFQVGA